MTENRLFSERCCLNVLSPPPSSGPVPVESWVSFSRKTYGHKQDSGCEVSGQDERILIMEENQAYKVAFLFAALEINLHFIFFSSVFSSFLRDDIDCFYQYLAKMICSISLLIILRLVITVFDVCYLYIITQGQRVPVNCIDAKIYTFKDKKSQGELRRNSKTIAFLYESKVRAQQHVMFLKQGNRISYYKYL